MQENIKPVTVKKTVRMAFRTEPIWQYDVGHELVFDGFELPTAFEVHFSRSPMGQSITQIGTENKVTLPDMYAQSAGTIYAWLYIAGEDTGLTKYSIEIPVNRRAKITDQQPTPVEQSAIDQAIAALNTGVQEAEAAVAAIQDMGVTASTLEPGSQATVTKVVDPEDGSVTLEFGIPEGEQGQPGEDGVTPDLSVGTVSTLPAGSQATVTISGTKEAPVMNFGIPEGQPGTPGDPTTLIDDTAGAGVTNKTWSANKLATDQSAVLSAINATINKTEVWSDPVPSADFTRLQGKRFKSNNGIEDKSGYSILYVQAEESGFYDIVFSKSNAQNAVKVYSSDTFTGSTYVKTVAGISASHKQVEVEAGQYIAASAWYTDYTLTIKRKTGDEYNIPLISETIKNEENNIFPTGWVHLPIENFSLNDWISYNSTSSSRSYRVRYTLPLQFPYDVAIRAAIGFYISGYYSNGQAAGNHPSIFLPKNTAFKVYIRRKTEDSSEIADIAEFANALTISTPLAGIIKYRYTFTDISMFERVGIGGDSYASGGGYISGIRSLTWGKNLERQAGIIVDIYAQSGQAIHTSTGWNYNETNGLPALLAGEECGLYWLAHGINSSASSCGEPEDMEASPKPYTFYGQYAYAIEAIQAKFPRARIVISTVEGSNMSLYQTENAAINTAIKNIAEHFSIPLIDLANDDFYWSKFYENNGLSNHPTAMLCAGMAMANRRLLANAIIDNPSYFIDFGNKYKTAISCPMVEGGSISASPSIAANGATVTLSNTPLPGYHFVRYESSDVTITDGSFVVPGTSGGVGHGTYTITGVFEADT